MKRWIVLTAATSCASCCCHAFAPPTHHNNIDGSILLRPSTAATTTTRVFLFDLKQRLNNQQRSPQQQLSRSRIPEEEIYYLSRGFGFNDEDEDAKDPFQLPYTIDLTSPSTRISVTPNGNIENEVAASKLLLRHLEVKDIKSILPEIVREFGAYEVPTSTGSKLGDEVATWIENFLFSFTVLVGLDQRVERRKKGYGNNSNVPPDHNVVCLVEVTPVTTSNNNGNDSTTAVSYNEKIVGIAELSWQPPDPTRNAPPFVLPYFAKDLISRFITNDNGTNNRKVPKGYVSNVLTWKSRRGLGYSRVLMAALEGIARRWGCDDIRLHVDADELTGKVARGLYWSLGYEAVPDRGNNKVGYEWMGPSMANRGLYLVEGVPLLYLRKSLNEQDNMQ